MQSTSRLEIKKQRKQSGRRLKLVTVAIALFSLFAGSFAAIAIRDVTEAKGQFVSARASLLNGVSEARAFNFSAAQRSLEGAHSNFLNAQRTLKRPSFRLTRVIPALGDNICALDKIAVSGAEAATAGLILLNATTQMNDTSLIQYSGGRLDLAPIIDMRPHIKRASVHLKIAVAEAESVSQRYLLAQIKGPHAEYTRKLHDFQRMVATIDNVSQLAPAFLGAEERRTYFLAIQNSAELRATGGLIGNFGVVTADGGKLSLADFAEIGVLQQKVRLAADVPRYFDDRYRPYKSASNLSNVNMSPDFPVVSNIVLQLYKNGTGKSLDGVIAVDPIGLKYLLEAIGPTRIPEASLTVTAENIVDLTLVDAYSAFEVRGKRKDFLKYVAVAIWKRLASGDIERSDLLPEKLSEALRTGHIMLYSQNPGEQQFLSRLGCSGELRRVQGDYLQVVCQNLGANKVDIYLDQSIDYRTTIREDGSVVSKVTVALANNTPLQGLPKDVLGDSPRGARNGQSNAYLSVYVPKSSRLLSYNYDGKAGKPLVGQEKDKTIFSYDVRVPAGERRSVSFTYVNASAATFVKNSRGYHLTWQVQPTARDPKFTLAVLYPHGFVALPKSIAPPESADLNVREGKMSATGTLQADSVFSFTLKEQSSGPYTRFKNWLKRPLLN